MTCNLVTHTHVQTHTHSQIQTDHILTQHLGEALEYLDRVNNNIPVPFPTSVSESCEGVSALLCRAVLDCPCLPEWSYYDS